MEKMNKFKSKKIEKPQFVKGGNWGKGIRFKGEEIRRKAGKSAG